MPLNTQSHIQLEVCVASVDDAVAACRGGSDRIELNMGLELGGLTPSVGLLEEVKQAVDIPVVAMVRPTPGGFCYAPSELRLMMRDAELLLAAGADGIVCGVLYNHETLHRDFWNALKKLTEDRELIFHRALDVVSEPSSLLPQLIDLGTTRVLTSGGRDTAWDGRKRIAEMQQTFGDRIEILPGSGISPDNALPLIRSTRCTQIHGSFSRSRHEHLPGWLRDHCSRSTSEDLIVATRSLLDKRFDT